MNDPYEPYESPTEEWLENEEEEEGAPWIANVMAFVLIAILIELLIQIFSLGFIPGGGFWSLGY